MQSEYDILSLRQNEASIGGGLLHQMSIRDTYRLHSHRFFEFFYVAQGMAIHKINNTSQVLSEGDFVLIRPNDIHRYDFFNEFDMELINLSCATELFENTCCFIGLDMNRVLEPQLPPVLSLTKEDSPYIKETLLRFEQCSGILEKKQYLTAILPYLTYRFIPYLSAAPAKRVPGWLGSLLEDMNLRDHYVEGLPYMLRSANISQEHLTREFRRHLNMSPTEFINMKRLSLATGLLMDTDLEIIDICHESGFNNVSHFYHSFKKQFGVTPKQFLRDIDTLP